jgi:hypothetical protein
MGTIYRERGVLVRMYRDHNPPHCHVSTVDGDVQVSLSDLRIIRGTIAPRDFEIALRWMQQNRDFLNSE